MTRARDSRIKNAILGASLCGLAAGLGLQGAGLPVTARIVWSIGVLPALVSLAVEIVRGLRRREVGLDVVAALSISTALIFNQPLAAAVVGVMYSGGTFLESYAEGRARREMHSLLSRAPRSAMRHREGSLEDVPLEEVEPGDLLLIRQGDVVPADGLVASEKALLDTSALTGEPLPVLLRQGAEVMSGSTNAGDAFDLTAIRDAEDSTYAGIVRLVQEAQQSRAPVSRLADRWSLGFLVVTVTLASVAAWLAGDVVRAVAVLVVATPCPLILAVPVALIAGLSRAARFGVLIKGAGPLEAMAKVRTLILDKTGTLTDGRPQIISIESCGWMDEAEILRFAAALDQASKHPVAQAIVSTARRRNLSLSIPSDIEEAAGEGITGWVEGRKVAVGSERFAVRQATEGECSARRQLAAGSTLVALAVGGRMAGRIVMSDPLREGVAGLLDTLRRKGISRILLATGDRIEVARRVTEGVGLDGLRAGLSPDQKVLLVLSERKNGPVMMVGDGVNDAPALAAADVGVAMGARGAAAAAEAADVVLLTDGLDNLAPGIDIARSSLRIATESVVAGIGLSVAGMIAAALGFLPPVQGAVLQEVIDVAVILNALRVLRIRVPAVDLGHAVAQDRAAPSESLSA